MLPRIGLPGSGRVFVASPSSVRQDGLRDAGREAYSDLATRSDPTLSGAAKLSLREIFQNSRNTA